MREIDVKVITEKVRDLCVKANTVLDEDVLQAFDRAIEKEESPVGADILRELKENARIAREENVAICQDTGFAVVFLEIGQDVHLTGGDLAQASTREFGRDTGRVTSENRSVIPSPVQTQETTRLRFIHTDIVPGDKVKITVAPKGAGSENMSRVMMLTPSDGIEG